MKMFMRPGINKKRGSILLITLILMITLTVFVTSFLSGVLYDNRTVDNQTTNSKALYLAEAGLNKAMWYLLHTAPNGTTNGSWRTTAYPAASGAGATDPKKESFADGTYTMWVQDYGDGSILITASGTYNNFTKTIHQRVNLSSASGELVGWWKFDEGEDETATDSSGNSYDGTFVHSPQWISGRIKNALSFNGSNSYVNLPNAPNVSNSSLTITAWAQRNGRGSGPDDIIFCQGENNHNKMISFGFYGDTFGVNCSWDDLHSTTSYPDTDWHLWALTWDANNNQRRIYRDGVIVANDVADGNYQGQGNTYIGARLDNGSYFNGAIDDVRVYNTALSTAQIKGIYLDGDPNLVAHWTFDDGTATDSMGNYDGTLNNGPTKVSGKVGSGALSFTSSNQNVSIPTDIIALNNASKFSITGWANIKGDWGNGGNAIFGKLSDYWHDIDLMVSSNHDWFMQVDNSADHDSTGFVNNSSLDNQWAFVSGVFDGTKDGDDNRLKLYLNGAPQSLSFNNTPFPATSPNIPGAPQAIGSYAGSGWNFNGYLDDIRIYSKPLSDDEVTSLYSLGNIGGSGNRKLTVVPQSWAECGTASFVCP
ncbi:MAG: LamG domain-containing protein [Candidatus Omnitrophica bacterium]|nr:LamG domain-containing protein [Candidatus Omnitrophota bacterium]